ncbi:hypothetical protein GJ654_10330 [Rhodoblastus acidophilus]|uniref:Uncharacterized protein n=1 Tax=Rhodoblastus acidophilus TaxID=1074 RepID=A0A6N8DLJ0_RHOAC|nr:hypothetical protein [Rhodoblastus acidophilus]MCW2275121.1 hypothetical protein [Rhodoblastus acidophilus]MTV31390.1 hypothetical protein [Rhodoblastus acidophilus]
MVACDYDRLTAKVGDAQVADARCSRKVLCLGGPDNGQRIPIRDAANRRYRWRYVFGREWMIHDSIDRSWIGEAIAISEWLDKNERHWRAGVARSDLGDLLDLNRLQHQGASA